MSTSFGAALVAWTVAGVGVGLAYPSLYIGSTTVGDDTFTATELATAVITAEAFGGLLGRAAGGAIVSLNASRTYATFAAFLAVAVLAAIRSHNSCGRQLAHPPVPI